MQILLWTNYYLQEILWLTLFNLCFKLFHLCLKLFNVWLRLFHLELKFMIQIVQLLKSVPKAVKSGQNTHLGQCF